MTKLKNAFFKKTNKIDKTLGILVKKKRGKKGKSKSAIIKNKKGYL